MSEIDLDSRKASPADESEELVERCRMLGIEWLEKAPEIDTEVSGLIEPDVAVRLRVIPIERQNGHLLVAMADPLDVTAADEVGAIVGLSIKRVGLDGEAFGDLMRGTYGTTAARMAESLAADSGMASTTDLEHNLDAIEAGDIHRMAEEPTLINLVNLLLLEAIQSRTSDVHIEPFESELKVKYRVDGVLAEQSPPPKHLQPALIGRIKIMAGMNIAERYVPQDGHITLRFEGRKVDIRVSTVPTLYGESVVMRILDKSSIQLQLETLGMDVEHRDTMDSLISKPHGLVLVTGPTGSGKTTTLYACLSKLYDPRKKIITIEDPVEYELGGINQIPVNPKRGLTFATGLRAILRQDPDVIFVGETRDAETIDIVIRSALTGHLVFSTLHTNDALSSVGRMIDMGAEPYLAASVLEGLLAQRLGRRLCPECMEWTTLSEDLSHRLTPQELELLDGRMPVARGCEACKEQGFYGRLGFFELIRITPNLRSAIAENSAVYELKNALSEDFRTMRDDGMAKVARGETSIDEVLRATQDVDEG